MTPDPITTAREALERLWKARDLCHPDSMIMHYDSVMAAFDYVEKLKAEADPEALVIAHMHGAQMATEKHREEITRLTSQLEQAERVIAPFAEEGAQTEYWSGQAYYVDVGGNMSEFTVADLRAASQWIKDRQAKTDAPIGDK